MQHDRVLALGFFDGIHLGHAALLDKTRERARELSLTPAAMSFDTHPDTLVFGTAVPLLNTMAERELLMRWTGSASAQRPSARFCVPATAKLPRVCSATASL